MPKPGRPQYVLEEHSAGAAQPTNVCVRAGLQFAAPDPARGRGRYWSRVLHREPGLQDTKHRHTDSVIVPAP